MLNNKIVLAERNPVVSRCLLLRKIPARLWTRAELPLDSSEPNRPRLGSGLVESYSGRILVEDASGVRFYVHEYRGRRTFVRTRRYMLDTGESVRAVDDHTFVIERTGETLVRVDDG
jgi:hypothetical protein